MHAPFVLSIDWDYFVGDNSLDFPCDVCRWSCYDVQDYKPELRRTRVGTDLPSTLDYQMIMLSPIILQFAPDDTFYKVPIVVADCHASLYRLLPPHSYVYNIDHHIDTDSCGSEAGFGKVLSCANWATVASANKGVHYEWCYRQPLPDFNLAKFQKPIPVDRMVLTKCERRYDKPDMIFVCWSTPYANPDLDDWFFKAIFDLVQYTKTEPRFVGLGSRKLRKSYISGYGRDSANNGKLLPRNSSACVRLASVQR